jgi:lipoprotein-releasing system permease protein
VVNAAPFITKEVMLLSKHNVAAVNARGILPDNKILQQPLLTSDNRPAGELLFASDTTPTGIIIALDTAAALGVAVGDAINVIPPMFNVTPFGMIPKMKTFRVVGIMQQRGGFIDTYFAYLDLAQAQSFFALGGAVSGIEIEVDSFDQARPIA